MVNILKKRNILYKDKLLNNKSYLIILYIFNMAVQSFVFVCGDDYMYGTFGNNGIIKNVFSYYMTGNGRWLVNILDSLILKYDRYIFIFINPLIICFVVLLLSKIANKLSGKYNDKTLKIAAILVSSLNILMTREAVYWITGSMNYLFPSFLFLLAYYLFLEIKSGNYKYIKIFPIVTFIAGASVEQFGLMLVGILTIEYLYRCIKHKKINKYEKIAYITSIIGLVSIVIAPGNFVRIDAASNDNQSIIIGIIDLVYNIFYSDVAKIYIMLLAIYMFLYIYIIYPEYKKELYIALFNVMFTILWIAFPKNILILISLCINLFLVIFLCYTYVKTNKDISLVLLGIAGIGSQVMLLISTIWGFRISFSMYIIIFIFMLYLSSHFSELSLQLALLIGIYNINVIAGIVASVIFLLAKYYNEIFNYNIISVLGLIVIIINLSSNAIGYYKNYKIQQGNIQMLELREDDTIVLNKLDNEIYGWSFSPLSEFHENYMRQYYMIPKSIKIIYGNK